MNAHIMGHNEAAVRLGMLADAARMALDAVSSGEGQAIDGWIAYGAALNEGRALFQSDEQFGQWVAALVSDKLSVTANDHERAAAMWAAANAEQFSEARAAGNARTVRGIYAKWKDIQAQREADEARAKADALRAEAQARATAEAQAREAVQLAKDEASRIEAEAKAEEQSAAKAKAEAIAALAEREAAIAEKRADIPKVGQRLREALDDFARPDHYRTIHTGENEWYTPPEYIDYAREVLGEIDLDPASCAQANEVVRAGTFYTQADDGLSRQWFGRVWMNPPYSRDLMPAFCEKLAESYESGAVEQAILLSHNNTDTAWFHRLGDSCTAICFPKRRIKFYRDNEIAAPTNGQAFFYFGPNADRFISVFGAIGLVVVPA